MQQNAEKSISKHDTACQFVEVDNHRANTAEQTIQTFKSHFVAGLCTVDPNFPLQLWDELLPQAELTLNLLRTSRTDPTMSAHEVLEGLYDFNKTPIAPPRH